MKKNQFANKLIVIDLLSVQRESFYSFLTEGLAKELNNFSPIIDYTGKLELHLVTNQLVIKKPKFSFEEAKRRDCSYTISINIVTQLFNKNSGDVKEQEILLGEIPLMTQKGTFVINGAERVIVNQIVRSPGIYFNSEMDKNNLKTFNFLIIPNRGAWLKCEIDKNDLIWIRIDKNKKINLSIFFKALGIDHDDLRIKNAFRQPEFIYKNLNKDENYTQQEALEELHKKLFPGEPATSEASTKILYFKFFNPKKYDLGIVGRKKINKKLDLNSPENIRILTIQDILSGINYLINLKFGFGNIDDIDHLANRRLKSVGELLQSQISIGLIRLERLIKERMTICEQSSLVPSALINPKPIFAAIKEFFNSSQLSQFMDQVNPLAELTHKRRVSSLGPGGLSKERAGFAVRDIHPSHYGRICPIETPEGPNAGLIGSLAIYARINPDGFIEAPFYKVNQGQVLKNKGIIYLDAEQEDEFKIAPGDIRINETNFIKEINVPVRYRQEFTQCPAEEIDFIAVSPIQVISAATSLIPFLEHNDANRALMGSNMQRQAVPLIFPERPLVGTGLEAQIAKDSGIMAISRSNGIVKFTSAEKIIVTDSSNNQITYNLQKYQKSNQETCINHRPIVWPGERIKKGQILADGSATDTGELALGRDVLVAYMPWEGYNYEDAFLISDRLVYEDLYTSIHIEKYEIEARQTKLGPEEITRNIPNVGENSLKQLDENGIVVVSSFVESGSILVGKVTPKGESDQPPESKLLQAIFGEKNKDVKDTSLRLPNGTRGRVVDVRIFSREKGDELAVGINYIVRIYVAQKRKIQIGDKMAGRHGNKGIISKILPRQDMPYLPNGTPVDIILNPLGVPSRMNVGQIFECILGISAFNLKKRFRILPFDEMYESDSSRILINQKLKEAQTLTNLDYLFNENHLGKVALFDGRSGEKFDNPVLVGKIYMMKLVHLVDDKIHSRSTGPYSLVTQQPLGGKAQQGGQRLGEMEVWAFEAFGAAYALQELLTIKSDDIQGRNEALTAIVRGKTIPKPGTPESLKVLMREIQSLGLDIAAYRLPNLHHGEIKSIEIDLTHNKIVQKR
uniref:DNA-directed RNA polymerase subunit beta n=1 Tax=Cyanidium caldarium TaxID=2771 RepID=RPOB_CYACA|nr:RNA polymerase beta subunit [Cyanidium caldarium]Q9TM35.1 RecName: Full=DNA-directed RNA polymerase subunit beta; AltName: Full=PEP; AltName: Full=Plastid-encoded RNA polymerase subunit beta; Short=RNA polymerase subunit beta [Cyanidium caldarium]AAF13014.1 unknown [Cyanidium caldarium]WDB00158.1 RNA polymerase beta subunit [Cyanidium caldarium]